jgi:hypothetical protein
MKKKLQDIGTSNYWLLDGLGALLGIPPPEIRGSNREVVAEVADLVGPDNVHLSESRKKNVAKVICHTLIGLRDGKLGKDFSAANVSGTAGHAKSSHFWRGFVSPVGIPPAPEQLRKKHSHRQHPYAGHKKRN